MYEYKRNEKAKINLVYNPSDEVQKIREHVYTRYTDMKNGRFIHGQSLEELWDRYERQYEAWRPPKDADDWQSNIVPPFTTSIVERALSEIVGQTMRPKVTARGKEDKPKAKLMNYILDYTWEIGDGDLELQAVLKDILVLGKGIWQEDYYIDKRKVKILKRFDFETNEEVYEDKEVFDFNDVYGERVPLQDFFLDPNAETINRGRKKADDCIRRYVLSHEMFLELFKDTIWDSEKACQYVVPGTQSDYYSFYEPPTSIRANEVEVLFYFSRSLDKFVIVANDVVLRNKPIPYNHKQLPFAEGSDVKRLHGFWAMGQSKLLESIQDELTTIRRMRIDRVHLDIFKTLLVSNREVIDDEDSIVRPSHMLPVDDPSNVKALEYGDINPSAYKEEEDLKQDGREVTGVQNPQPSGTATEAAIFKESTMKTLQMKVWGISRELMMGIVRLRVPNITQYYSAPNIEKILGEEEASSIRRITTHDVALDMTPQGELKESKVRGDNFFDVTPDMVTPLYGYFNFRMVGDPTFPLSKPLQQQKVNEFMASPIFQAAVQTGYYSVEKAADKLSEVNEFDPEDFKAEQPQETENLIDPAQLMELANRENKQLLAGKQLPGTPFSTLEHTKVHLAFMGSQPFIEAMSKDPNVGQAFASHIMAEDQAQKMRSQGMPSTMMGMGRPEASLDEGTAIMQGEAKAANPGKVIGSEMLPRGLNGK